MAVKMTFKAEIPLTRFSSFYFFNLDGSDEESINGEQVREDADDVDEDAVADKEMNLPPALPHVQTIDIFLKYEALGIGKAPNQTCMLTTAVRPKLMSKIAVAIPIWRPLLARRPNLSENFVTAANVEVVGDFNLPQGVIVVNSEMMYWLASGSDKSFRIGKQNLRPTNARE